ncbi:MAG TPA: hypothetical protein VGJ38_12440 [Jatrophihabitantaceae bacterium]
MPGAGRGEEAHGLGDVGRHTFALVPGRLEQRGTTLVGPPAAEELRAGDAVLTRESDLLSSLPARERAVLAGHLQRLLDDVRRRI